MLEELTLEQMIREVYITMITPQNARGFGRGGLSKLPDKGYPKPIEIAIDQRGSLGWQVKDTNISDPTKQWVDFDYVGIECTIVNYQIREVQLDEGKQLESQNKIAELEEEIEALANKPELREKKERALAELTQSIENAETYIYLRAVDRQNQYSIRMRPDNIFAISLFNQLRVVVTQDHKKTNRNDHRLAHAVKIGIEKRPSARETKKVVTFATLWTLGDKTVWIGEDEVMTKESWRPIWKEVVTSVGDYVRVLHSQPNLDNKNKAIGAGQSALPPAKSDASKTLLLKIKEAANEAFNNDDLKRINGILNRVNNEKETIDRLSNLIDEAREYVSKIAAMMATEQPDEIEPKVIDVETIPVIMDRFFAEQQSSLNPEPS